MNKIVTYTSFALERLALFFAFSDYLNEQINTSDFEAAPITAWSNLFLQKNRQPQFPMHGKDKTLAPPLLVRHDLTLKKFQRFGIWFITHAITYQNTRSQSPHIIHEPAHFGAPADNLMIS